MLLRLLASPIRLPVGGALWLAERICETAEAELNEPAKLKARLAAIEKQLEAGEITEEAFEVEEAAIIKRLRTSSTARDTGGALDGR